MVNAVVADVSTRSKDICHFCVEQEATKLLAVCLELDLELKTREDVRNLIRISGYESIYSDPLFIEQIIDVFLELA